MSLAGNQKQHDLPVLKSEVYRNERSIDTRPLAQLWQQQNSLICEKPRMDDVSLSMSFMSTDRPTHPQKTPTVLPVVGNLWHKSLVSGGHQKNVSALPQEARNEL